MAKREGWSKPRTPSLTQAMEASAEAAYQNACTLLDDAHFLYLAERFPRAAALAILAEEEFSKAFLLKNCAAQGRWDSAIFDAITKHSNKQGVAEATRAYSEWLSRNLRHVAEINRTALITVQPELLPGKHEWDEILQNAKKTFAKPVRDFLKQDALYVGVDQDARLTSTPDRTRHADAEKCINDAEKFKVFVDIIFGRHNAVAKWLGSSPSLKPTDNGKPVSAA